ncbi:MAG: guanylate kinase [Flavobacteriaceae bacterium]|nr:guanylate kinase [Flavobacteriaceae bacterium]
MKSGKLFVFSAPSGSGKTTLVKHLLQQGLPLGFSISATSRAPRGEEVDGKDYYFLSEEAFRQKIEEDAFIEYEEVYEGNFYGTLRSEIDRLWAEGKHVLFDIDVIGGLNVKAEYPEETLAIFVQPPSFEELEKRLRERNTETEDKIQQRLDKSATELTYSQDFDLILVNDDLTKAKREVVGLVKQFLRS